MFGRLLTASRNKVHWVGWCRNTGWKDGGTRKDVGKSTVHVRLFDERNTRVPNSVQSESHLSIDMLSSQPFSLCFFFWPLCLNSLITCMWTGNFTIRCTRESDRWVVRLGQFCHGPSARTDIPPDSEFCDTHTTIGAQLPHRTWQRLVRCLSCTRVAKQTGTRLHPQVQFKPLRTHMLSNELAIHLVTVAK